MCGDDVSHIALHGDDDGDVYHITLVMRGDVCLSRCLHSLMVVVMCCVQTQAMGSTQNCTTTVSPDVSSVVTAPPSLSNR